MSAHNPAGGFRMHRNITFQIQKGIFEPIILRMVGAAFERPNLRTQA
jgi:hypothetical protein